VNLRDLIFDTYRDSGPKVAMTITHKPTGARVSGTGESEILLRERLLAELELRTDK
jgi:hypothetical protein